MKAALGETHPLVQLTLACMEYDQEDRPSAVVVLKGLEEVATTLPQNCTQTKLELIQQVAVKEEEIQRGAAEKLELIQLKEEMQQVAETKINWLQQQIFEKHDQISQLQEDDVRLQTEKRERVHELEEQQEQLEVQRREIDRLSSLVRSLQIQPREYQCQGSKQTEVIA